MPVTKLRVIDTEGFHNFPEIELSQENSEQVQNLPLLHNFVLSVIIFHRKSATTIWINREDDSERYDEIVIRKHGIEIISRAQYIVTVSRLRD